MGPVNDDDNESGSRKSRWQGEVEGWSVYEKVMRTKFMRKKVDEQTRDIFNNLWTEEDFVALDAGTPDAEIKRRREYSEANAEIYDILMDGLGTKAQQDGASTAAQAISQLGPGMGLELWQAWQKEFNTFDAGQVDALEDMFKAINFGSKNVRNLTSYIAEVQKIAAKLRENHQPCSDTKTFRQILKGLPELYDVVRQNLWLQLQKIEEFESSGRMVKDEPTRIARAREVSKRIGGLVTNLTRWSHDTQMEQKEEIKSLFSKNGDSGALFQTTQVNSNGPSETGSDSGGEADEEVICQLCDKKGHGAKKCPKLTKKVMTHFLNMLEADDPFHEDVRSDEVEVFQLN